MTRAEPRRPQLVADGPAFEATGLVHRVRQPRTSPPAALAVLLHGRQGDEDRMWVFGRALPTNWLAVAPRGPVEDPGGGYAWRPREPDEWPPLDAFGSAAESLARFVAGAREVYASDCPLFLIGFSQGAATAIATTGLGHLRPAGLVVLVGFAPDGTAEAPGLAAVPTFMAIGEADPLVPGSVSDASEAALRQAGADLTVHRYAVGHKLSAQGMRDLEAWLG